MSIDKGKDAETRLKTYKILVIGLDGATWDIIRPLVTEGKLPIIGRLMNDGCFGDLRSTYPPTSTPAWTSFMTGKNPAKHGITGFLAPQADGTLKGKRGALLNSTFIDAKTIWQILSEKGKRICIINCPMTYPPSKVNGIMISGMLTPISAENFTYPKKLKDEMKDYQIGLTNHLKLNDEAFLKELYHITNVRAKYALTLLQKEDWDLFVVVFTGIDRIQHRFWKYIDRSNPAYEKNGPWEKEITKYYQRIDGVIGELIDCVSKGTTVFLLSDHGFGPLQENFFLVNNWLANLGLMDTSSPSRARLQNVLSNILWIRKLIPKGMRKRVKARPNWKMTRAYGVVTYPSIGGINLNLIGREKRGTVTPGTEADDVIKKIGEALYSLEDQKGNKIIRKVIITKNEFFGSHVDDLPDIIFELETKYCQKLGTGFGPTFARFQVLYHKKVTGTHRMNGILVISGPFIKKGLEIKGAEIIDIAPTILYLMGLPIPNDFDGRVLEDAIQRTHLDSEPIVFTEAEEFDREQSKYLYDEKERKQIEDKLRALGYI